jgi:hypothetical protein
MMLIGLTDIRMAILAGLISDVLDLWANIAEPNSGIETWIGRRRIRLQISRRKDARRGCGNLGGKKPVDETQDGEQSNYSQRTG